MPTGFVGGVLAYEQNCLSGLLKLIAKSDFCWRMGGQ